MLRLCVAGAAGRMGNAVIQEARAKGHQITGAIEAPGNACIGRTLKDLGICDVDTRIVASDRLIETVKDADVYVTFTTPEAEMRNVPIVVEMRKKVVLGTTGLSNEQNQQLVKVVLGKVPAVFSPNFSVGINIFFKLARALDVFPPEYTFSISEIHHTSKKDAPSGTAKKLGQIVAEIRGYNQLIYGREGMNPRQANELEITAIRAGGVPGIHDLIVAGSYEMLRIEHTAFSRNVFAQGAVYAAEWVSKQNDPRIFSMEDVLGFR